MNKTTAINLIRDTFEHSFSRKKFAEFSKELLNHLDISKHFVYAGNYIPDAYEPFIQKFERIGQYNDGEKTLDVLVIHLKKYQSLERARTRQRNFIAWYLDGSRGGELRDGAVVAVVSPDSEDWRFALVKMEYDLAFSEKTGKVKTEKRITPARRYSFLVGQNESSHTAQKQLFSILCEDKNDPTFAELESAFNIEVVTKEFFNKYRELFNEVKEALDNIVAANAKVQAEFDNKGIDTENFAKKLLGQIVFLYFLQKKGWFGVPENKSWGDGDKRFLRNIFDEAINKGKNFFNDYLEYLFYDALANQERGTVDSSYYSRFNCKIPFLNGGLFDPLNGYEWIHCDILLPNELFSNTEKTKEGDNGTGILDIFDRYNFTVKEDEPLDKDVAVDPEMLGKVFENMLEVKDRKSKGTYYTPREIVHYMCQESLINYLDTALNTGEVPLAKTAVEQSKMFGAPDPKQAVMTIQGAIKRIPREDIEVLIHYGDMTTENDSAVEEKGKETRDYSFKLPFSIRQNARLLDDKLKEVRVCDPTVGSGAFPVGLMMEIVQARNALSPYLKNDRGRNYYNFKRHAIQNCLYGVDIDPGAVEIAKLRLWLSLVVDEEDIRQIQPLPNLDYKIVCGNSLIGVPKDVLNWPLFEKLEKLKPLYFNETSPGKKQICKKEIDSLIDQITNGKKVFDFEVYFSEVFHEDNKGFDIVTANPPYIRQEQLKEIKPELKKLYQCYDGTADIYVYFYERGQQLLKNNGTLTYISSNKYFRSGYGKKLRQFMADKCQICQIIDFGDAPVFEAIAYPSIIVIKNNVSSNNKVNILSWNPGPPLSEFASVVRYKSIPIPQKELTSDGWRLESPVVLRLLEKLNSTGKPLDDYVNERFYRGIVTGCNEAFVIDQNTKDRLIAEHVSSTEVIKPFLRGKDVKRWHINFAKQYLLFVPWHFPLNNNVNISGASDRAERVFCEKYPAIYQHLMKYKIQLESRNKDETGIRYEWYALQRCAATYWQEFEQPKIVWGNLAMEPQFAFAAKGYYINAPANIIVSDSKYLLGVLNSRVTKYLVSQSAAGRQGGYLEYKPMYISPLAIPEQPEDECISEFSQKYPVHYKDRRLPVQSGKAVTGKGI